MNCRSYTQYSQWTDEHEEVESCRQEVGRAGHVGVLGGQVELGVDGGGEDWDEGLGRGKDGEYLAQLVGLDALGHVPPDCGTEAVE